MKKRQRGRGVEDPDAEAMATSGVCFTLARLDTLGHYWCPLAVLKTRNIRGDSQTEVGTGYWGGEKERER